MIKTEDVIKDMSLDNNNEFSFDFLNSKIKAEDDIITDPFTDLPNY